MKTMKNSIKLIEIFKFCVLFNAFGLFALKMCLKSVQWTKIVWRDRHKKKKTEHYHTKQHDFVQV
jgi:hypothetical protein